MSARHFRTVIFVWSLALTCPLYAGLSPDEYDLWQAYNGWRIRVIEFPGIQSFARQELLLVMVTEKPTWLRRYVRIGHRSLFFADDFAADVLRVERFYRREGFPEAVVNGRVFPDENRKELRLQFEIHEGDPLLLRQWQLEIVGDQDVGVDSNRWSAAMPIKIGKRVGTIEAKASADTLAFKLREIGHARAQVGYHIQVDSVVADSQHSYAADLTFTLVPGPFCTLGQTRVSGLKQISEGTVRRELAYDEGDPFAPRRLENTRLRLVRMEAFNMVTVRADTSAEGNVLPVNIALDEGRRYRLRLSGGYDTIDKLRVGSEFTDVNFFGRARKFTLAASYADLKRQVSARLLWPHTPWEFTDVTLTPAWTLEVFPGVISESYTQTTLLAMKPSEKTAVSLNNQFGHKRIRFRGSTVESDSAQTETPRTNYFTSTEGIAFSWDTRDHPLVPRKGHFIGLAATESGAFYRTDVRWWRATIQGTVLMPRGRFTVFGLRSKFGYMQPLFESETTPIEERFYLGGPSTVRGWGDRLLAPRSNDEQQTAVGGDVSWNGSAEVRQNIWGPVSLALFADAGNVWSTDKDIRPFDLFTTAGLGLLFLTPVGPVRTDLGYQLRPNPYGEAKYSIHLSLGTPF